MQFQLKSVSAISLNYKHHPISLTNSVDQNIYFQQCRHAKSREQETIVKKNKIPHKINKLYTNLKYTLKEVAFVWKRVFDTTVGTPQWTWTLFKQLVNQGEQMKLWDQVKNKIVLFRLACQ